MHPSQFDLLQRARTVTAALTKIGGHHIDGDKIYVDTAFINAAGRLPGCNLEHMGFGEFSLKTPKGEVEFDKMRGKPFEGASGRPHQLYDSAGGQKASEWLVEEMEKKNLSVKTASSMTKEAAAPVLWKYTDEEKGKDFYLKSRKTTVKSPWTGKTFTAKPEKESLTNVGKELKQEGAKNKSALWKYTDDDGNEFYLDVRLTATVKSPWTGKAFTPKAEKEMLTDIARVLGDKDKPTVTRADGEKVEVSIPGRECPACEGDGREWDDKADKFLDKKCSTCGGSGKAGEKGSGGGGKAAMPKSRGKKKASDDAAWKAEGHADAVGEAGGDIEAK